MQANRFFTWAMILACSTAFTALAIADDDEQGGDIEGNEQLDAEIVLTATTNAPAGATGKAELEVENEYGVTTAELEVETEGLAAGTYTVSVTRKSDGSTVALGTFDVSDTTTDEDDDSEGEDSEGDNDDQDETEIEFGGEAGLPLPPDLNPMDIATIAIADADGNVVLTGDFTDISTTMKSVFKAKVVAVAGSIAPNATGRAVLHSRIKKGVAKTKFLLVAQGLTPNTALTVTVNGATAGTVTSNQRGKVMMKSLPAGAAAGSLTSIQLLDGSSNIALSVSF